MTSFETPCSGDLEPGGARTSAFRRKSGDDDPSRQMRARRAQMFFGLSPDEISRVTTRARVLRKARGEFMALPIKSVNC
jgi:hypothetical protein